MNINKEGGEHQQQKQSQNLCTGTPAHKKETGTKLALSSLMLAHKASGRPQNPCTTQKLNSQLGPWSDQRPLRQQEA